MISLYSLPPPDRKCQIRCMGNGSRPKCFVTIPIQFKQNGYKLKKNLDQCSRDLISHLDKVQTTFQMKLVHYRSSFLQRILCDGGYDKVGASYSPYFHINHTVEVDFSSSQGVIQNIVSSAIHPGCFLWNFESTSTDVLMPLKPVMMWRMFLETQIQALPTAASDRKQIGIMEFACSQYKNVYASLKSDKRPSPHRHDELIVGHSSFGWEHIFSNLLFSFDGDCRCNQFQRDFETFDDTIDFCSIVPHVWNPWSLMVGNNSLSLTFLPSVQNSLKRTKCYYVLRNHLLLASSTFLVEYGSVEEDLSLVLKEKLFCDLSRHDTAGSVTGMGSNEISLFDSCLSSYAMSIMGHTLNTISICTWFRNELHKFPSITCSTEIKFQWGSHSRSQRQLGDALGKLQEINISKLSVPIKAISDGHEQVRAFGKGSLLKLCNLNTCLSDQLRRMPTTKMCLVHFAKRSSTINQVAAHLTTEKLPSSCRLKEIPESWSLNEVNRLAQPLAAEVESKKRPIAVLSPIPDVSPQPSFCEDNKPFTTSLPISQRSRSSVSEEIVADGPPLKIRRTSSFGLITSIGEAQQSLDVMESCHEEIKPTDMSFERPTKVINRHDTGPMDRFVQRCLPSTTNSISSSGQPELKTLEVPQVEDKQLSRPPTEVKLVETNSTTHESSRILSGLKILVAERFFEEHAIAVADLYSNHEIISIDGYISDPVDVIVSAECGMVVLTDRTFRDQSKLVSKIKSLLQLSLKFGRLWVVIMTDTSNDDPPQALKRLNAEKSKLSNALSRCGSMIILRDCRLSCGKELATILKEVCYSEYYISSSIVVSDSWTTKRLIDRPYLDLLQDSAFLAHCDFLQRFPTLNLFSCALLLSQWSLRELASLAKKDALAQLAKIYSFGPTDHFQQCISSFFYLLSIHL